MSRLGILEKGAYNRLRTFGEFFQAYYGDDLINRESVGFEFEVPKLTSAVYDPSILQIHNSADFEMIKSGNFIKQVMTESGFADVEKLPAGKTGFRIRIWGLHNNTFTKSGTFYNVSDATTEPLAEVIFEKPPGLAANESNELYIYFTENFGLNSSYQYCEHHVFTEPQTDGTGEKLVVTTYAGDDIEVPAKAIKRETLDYTRPSGGKVWDYTLTRAVEEAKNTADSPTIGGIANLRLVSKTQETYQDFSLTTQGGEYGARRMMSMVHDPDGAALTTTYDYYDVSGNPLLHGRQKSVTRPNGSWTYNEIVDSGNSQSPIETTYSSYLDVSMADRADAQKVVTEYGTNSVTRTTYLGGVEAAKSKISTTKATNGEISLTTTNFNGSEESSTVTVYNAHGGTALKAGRRKSQQSPDGTFTLWEYSGSVDMLVIDTKSGAGSNSAITNGTRTKQTFNQAYELIDEETYDINGSTEILIGFRTSVGVTGGEIDPQGRPTKWEYNGNAADYSVMKYGCCGATYSRDRSGAVTEYFRDALRRVYKTTSKRSSGGDLVTTFTTFDGLVTSTRRTAVGYTGDLFVGETTRSLSGLTITTLSPDADEDGDSETTIRTMDYAAIGGPTTTVTYPDGTSTETVSFLDGRTKKSIDQEDHETTYTYGAHNALTSEVTVDGNTTTVPLAPAGTQTTVNLPGNNESTTTYYDRLGRPVKMVYADGNATTYQYFSFTASTSNPSGSLGKLKSTTDPDQVTMTYGYDAEGDRTTTTRPIAGGLTQTTTSVSDVIATVTVKDNKTIAPAIRNVSTVNSVVTSTSYRSTDGRRSASVSFGRESFSETTVPNDGSWTSTTTSPEGVLSRAYYTDGLMKASVTYESDGTLPAGLPGPADLTDENFVSGSVLDHDAFGRVTLQADPRTGPTIVGPYLDNGSVLSVKAPGNRTTSFTYDKMGRRTTVDAPGSLDADGDSIHNITHTSYTDRGQVKATWGDQTYPRRYDYDAQGRMTKLHTWKTAPAGEPAGNGESITEWKYHTQRGWLVEKNYAGETDNGSADADYAYTDAGRLATRTWERGVSTTYAYDQGMLSAVTYSDDTPNLDYTYDNFGRILEVRRDRLGPADNPTTPGSLHASYGYDGNLLLTTEALNQDLPNKRTLRRYYDGLRRPLSAALENNLSNGTTSTGHSYAYSYDRAGRLETVAHAPDLDSNGVVLPANPGDVFTYHYEDLSGNLIGSIDGPLHKVTNTWELDRNVLSSKENHHLTDSTRFSKYAYLVNEIGQRTQVTQSGSAFDYDAASNTVHTLTWGYNPSGELIREDHSDSTRDNAYAYDAIGNRIKDSHGSLTLPGAPTFISNSHNQYDGLPAYETKSGTAVTITTDHDVDGNMTSGPVPGRRFNPEHGDQNPDQASNIQWDAENRMTSITIDGRTSTFEYDYLGRRIRVNEDRGDQPAQVRIYLYDGWNLIALFTGESQDNPPCAYTWGLDLSGSMQGAGGVGGLLAMRHGIHPYYPLYDGNGNVGQYLYTNPDIDSDTAGSQPGIDYKARWEYDSFGRRTKSGGDFQEVFLHQFSTKEKCWVTGLYYYGYRYYDPVTGRWPSRDPIEEEGGMNLYGFVGNEGINFWDFLGLVEVEGDVPKLKDVPVFWVNKPRIQNPGFTFAKANVGCFCIRDETTGKLKISCFFSSEIIISLNAAAKLRDKDIVGKPETWKRVFGHEVLHAKEIIRRLDQVIKKLEAEPEGPVTNARAAALSKKYKELVKKAIEEGKKEDPKGNPKDPRPVSGKGYNPPKGSPELPPNPFK